MKVGFKKKLDKDLELYINLTQSYLKDMKLNRQIRLKEINKLAKRLKIKLIDDYV